MIKEVIRKVLIDDPVFNVERAEIISHLRSGEMDEALRKCRVFVHKNFERYPLMAIDGLKLEGVNDVSRQVTAMDDLLSEGFSKKENIFQSKIDFLKKYVGIYGDYRIPHVLLAWEYLKHSDYKKAIDWALSACSLDERCMPSWFILKEAFWALRDSGRLNESLSESERKRLDPLGYDLRGIVCPLAFERVFVQSTGEVMCCCPPLLPIAVGNVFKDPSWQDIINSAVAIEIRESILDGSYKYCNRLTCQWLRDKNNDLSLREKNNGFFKFVVDDLKGDFLANPLKGEVLANGWDRGQFDAVRAKTARIPPVAENEKEKWFNDLRFEWVKALNEVLTVSMRPEDYRSLQKNRSILSSLDDETRSLLNKAVQSPPVAIDKKQLVQLNRKLIEAIHPQQIEKRAPQYTESNISTIGVLNLGFDQTCNLCCPQCRTDFIHPSEEKKTQLDHLAAYIIPDMVLSAKKIVLANTGDPFASKYYSKILESISPFTHPYLKDVVIFTNGLLFTPQKWEELSGMHNFDISVCVSVDAATKKTYEKVRPPGKWDVLVENLEFISGLKRERKIWYLELEYVIQDCNFREIRDFVSWAIDELAVSRVVFHRLINVGTYSSDDYHSRAVFEPSHPNHKEFIAILDDPIFSDARIILTDLGYCRNSAIRPDQPSKRGVPGISASSSLSGHAPEKAINPNNNPEHYWHSTEGLPQWWQIEYAQGKKISSLGLRPTFYEGSMIKNFSLQGSNDGISWDTIFLGEHANNSMMEYYNVEVLQEYVLYRVMIFSVWRSEQYAGLSEIVLK